MKNFIMNPNQKVVITFDGNVTLARIFDKNTMVSKGIATCCDEDEFDIKTGSEIALGRALEAMKPNVVTKNQEWVVVDRKPRVGDYFRVIDSRYPMEKPGDIYKISEVDGNVVGVRHGDHPAHKKLFKDVSWMTDNYIWNHNLNTNKLEILEKV